MPANSVFRFAPSPTGLLHVGNIRAALFNWLLARRFGGTFLLRLDDTDTVRSKAEYADAIKRDLAWLGLCWDRMERQSDRLAIYRETLEKLKKSGMVYPCFETQEELDLKRRIQLGRGLPPVYDRSALHLSDAEKNSLAQQGRTPHWRFRLPDGNVSWDDAIQGGKSIPTSSLSDPVLVRGDGVPLYTFCSVIDDIDFNVDHVIRGEDHVTNTVSQIAIWRALSDKQPPVFAHYPLLTMASGDMMSKRLGTLSIQSLRDEHGIEPMALNSLLAHLGTSEAISTARTLDDLAANFDLSLVSRATPRFDEQVLTALNARWLHGASLAEVLPKLAALGVPMQGLDENFWRTIAPNIVYLRDVSHWWNVAYGNIRSVIDDKDVKLLRQAKSMLPPQPWGNDTWSLWTKALSEASGRKGQDLFQPLRLALTGEIKGPAMKEFMMIIGYDKALQRLDAAIS